MRNFQSLLLEKQTGQFYHPMGNTGTNDRHQVLSLKRPGYRSQHIYLFLTPTLSRILLIRHHPVFTFTLGATFLHFFLQRHQIFIVGLIVFHMRREVSIVFNINSKRPASWYNGLNTLSRASNVWYKADNFVTRSGTDIKYDV